MINDSLLILLADSDENDRAFFKDALWEIKVKTDLDLANDGLQLMKYLEDPDNRLPDIVFMDLNIPVISGMECLIGIRKKNRLRDLAIAIYSTLSSEENIEDAFVKGANIYIKKPDDFLVLKMILEHILTINWQYHTSGLKKENFLLNINTIGTDEVS